MSHRQTLGVNKLRINKRFRSRKHVLSKSVIYVYCPSEKEKKIKELSKKYLFDVVLNDYTIRDLTRKVICHYDCAILESKHKDFLVAATEAGAWVEPLVSYLDERLGYTEIELLSSGYFLHQKAFSILSAKRTEIAKRVIDVFFSFLLFLFALPIGLVTAILIKLESKGPIFYKQKRTGLYNIEFNVIKFRSMYVDAESNGAQWASENDLRITRVGNFIRKTRIDELPQIINIIQGDMSIVGPRPEREVFISELEKEIPYYRFRHAVKPGVTGLAQVRYPYGASIEDAKWKHKYDIYYIKHHKTLTDFKILLKTIKIVIFGMGR
ncbi:exopolysaccharide biosynthesis polyprenyl glycosylphosphotransferase [Pseudoalteromonas ostreae]|uniref:exopolysaccharide biosynthesis polyprenyl glycosylphosphotransferase n=1 Tax=Pseudoalteromonas ostreae TaxID=2774154 RepID=UPI001B36BD0E|nr:exopolysaccharide biosynthesis polyprenyl glycosylphosphotransferase [Pseudoalteromonas ostreae]